MGIGYRFSIFFGNRNAHTNLFDIISGWIYLDHQLYFGNVVVEGLEGMRCQKSDVLFYKKSCSWRRLATNDCHNYL